MDLLWLQEDDIFKLGQQECSFNPLLRKGKEMGKYTLEDAAKDTGASSKEEKATTKKLGATIKKSPPSIISYVSN